MQKVVTDYFSQLLMTTGSDGKLLNREVVNPVKKEENEALISQITVKKVKETVFSMQPDKTPGPDRLNPTFIQSFWSIVEVM